jgi:hypothetical protein
MVRVFVAAHSEGAPPIRVYCPWEYEWHSQEEAAI